MIKCDKGDTVIKGNTSTVLSELSTLVFALHHHVFVEKAEVAPEDSRKMILEAVERGFKSMDQTVEDEEEALGNVMVKVLDMLKEIIQGKDVE